MAAQLTEEEVEEEFDADLYKDEVDWLDLYHPRLADRMKILHRYGWTPERVRKHIEKRLTPERGALAKRCENYVRYLMWEQKK